MRTNPGSRHTRRRQGQTRTRPGDVNGTLGQPGAGNGAIEPYPYQSYLLAPVLAAARAQGRTDVVAMWSGQATPLLEHRSAATLYAALTEGTDQVLTANSETTEGASR